MERTKGEWRVDKWGLTTIISAPTKRIATIDMSKSIPESLANAQFIASAPDLYETLLILQARADDLNRLVAEDESRYESWRHESDMLDVATDYARRALGKAEGK